jgi:hypothetical protein
MRNIHLAPLVFLCMFFGPLLAFLGTSIYVAHQPIDVHRLVEECLAEPNCAGR